MIDLRAPLEQMNTSELIELARAAGLGNLSHAYDRDEIIDAILDDMPLEPDLLEERRRAMEAHIQKHLSRLRSQLPGCPGTCTTFGCPDLVVARCWKGFSADMV